MKIEINTRNGYSIGLNFLYSLFAFHRSRYNVLHSKRITSLILSGMRVKGKRKRVKAVFNCIFRLEDFGQQQVICYFGDRTLNKRIPYLLHILHQVNKHETTIKNIALLFLVIVIVIIIFKKFSFNLRPVYNLN